MRSWFYSSIVVLTIIALCSCTSKLDRCIDEGMGLMDQEKYQEGKEKFDECIEIDPESSDAYDRRSYAYHALEDYDLALKDAQKAVKLDPENPQAYIGRGICYFSMNLDRNSIEDLNKAEELDHGIPIIYHNRALAYARLKDYEMAMRDVNKYLETEEPNSSMFIIQAEYHSRNGDMDKSIECLEKALDLDPNDELVLNNLGFTYILLEDYEAAAEIHNRMGNIENDSDEHDFLYYSNYGFVLGMLGDSAKSRDFLNKSVELNPENSYAYRNMAVILLHEGDTVTACRMMDFGLERGFTFNYGSELEDLKSEHCLSE